MRIYDYDTAQQKAYEYLHQLFNQNDFYDTKNIIKKDTFEHKLFEYVVKCMTGSRPVEDYITGEISELVYQYDRDEYVMEMQSEFDKLQDEIPEGETPMTMAAHLVFRSIFNRDKNDLFFMKYQTARDFITDYKKQKNIIS